MPKTPSTGFAHQAFLYAVANAGMLVRCECKACKRVRHYLASDLVHVFGGRAVVGELWGRCPKCGTTFRWIEQERYPTSDDVGHTLIRRPNGFRYIMQWVDEHYGPPATGPQQQYHLMTPISRPDLKADLVTRRRDPS
ncbi:hypothetical protein JP75_08145 [Devosia riboflavina]|uniref:Uncharacterized protein n=1 Tax=Devosia riboflavina TaxID=46914 RepID=A0A087M3P4_9HYPH|nr:hypothetical protein JP75_08145 [Devosia riboflavina]